MHPMIKRRLDQAFFCAGIPLYPLGAAMADQAILRAGTPLYPLGAAMDQDSLPLCAQTMTEPCAEAVLFPANATQTRQKRSGRRAGGPNFMPEWLSEVARWPTCRTRGLASRRPGRCSWLKATPCRCTSVTLNMISCSQQQI